MRNRNMVNNEYVVWHSKLSKFVKVIENQNLNYFIELPTESGIVLEMISVLDFNKHQVNTKRKLEYEEGESIYTIK